MWHIWWDGSGWHGWESLGGKLTATPACVSWGANRIDCFAIGLNGAMWHRWWDGLSWRGWEDLGGAFTSDLECTTWGANRIDCFATGLNKSLWHKWWNGAQWGGWEDLGGGEFIRTAAQNTWLWERRTYAPECVSPEPNKIVCAMPATDGTIRTREWNGSAWLSWTYLGGDFGTGASCTSWPGRIDCFAVDTRPGSYAMWHAAWNQRDGLWTAWENLGGGAQLNVPECLSWGRSRIDCFVIRTLSTHIGPWHTWWEGSVWAPWHELGAADSLYTPECVAWAANRLDCFIVGGRNGGMLHRYWDGAAWGPPTGPPSTSIEGH